MEPSWVGRRVSVRRAVRHGAGAETVGTRYSDVVGDLLALTDQTALLDTRNGLVEVRVAEVAIARLAPPSTADELMLQAVAAQGWRPAETGSVNAGPPDSRGGAVRGEGWLLRAAGGFTARANSVLPLRAPGLPLPDALNAAGAWYAERGLPLLIQLPVEARRLLDAELGERGWPAVREAHMLAGRLDQLRAPAAGNGTAAAVAVELSAAPDEAWLQRYRDGEALGGAARDLLVRHDRVVFASVRDGAKVLAVGRGVVDDTWLGVSAVEVDPAQRRRGLASAVMRTLWQWGREQGALRSYLQVQADNGPALALYERLGYWQHHSYHYRQQP